MRKWNCPYCGEEMLGDVNRCWNCSRRIDPPSLAPILIAEAAPEPINAAIVGGEDDSGAATAVATLDDAEPLTADDLAAAFAKEPPRRGSPFASMAELSDAKPFQPLYGDGPYSLPPRANLPKQAPPLAANYPRHSAAIGGVVGSLMLGLVSLVTLYFTVFGFITAAIGIGLGVWGLYGNRRTLAMFALLFCSIVLMINGYFVAIAVYEFWTGTSLTGGSGGW